MGAIRCPASPSTPSPLPGLSHRQAVSDKSIASTSAIKLPTFSHAHSHPSSSSRAPAMLVSRPQDVPHGRSHATPSSASGSKRKSLVSAATVPAQPQPQPQAATDALSTSSTQQQRQQQQQPSPFNRFRPSSHFMAPKGWMNDPAGPCYDGERHHLFYECNPKGSTWGNMSWAHATAPTLAGPWTHDCDKGNPVLAPSAPYDCEGIFTGCVVTHGPHGEAGMMTAIYTAVSSLPIHWSREYNRGCEKLALATSHDGGRSWQRDEARNPILPGPPQGIDVKSWRDPFVAPWDYMDETLGLEKGTHYYGLIAGSVPNVGPRLFLYRIPRKDLAIWDFVGTLGDGVDFNASLPGLPWSGEFGRNWEVGMFFSLPRSANAAASDPTPRDEEQYILLNVEGCNRADPARHPMWLSTSLSRRQSDGKPSLAMRKSGQLDWGCAYAASSFKDAATGRTMLWSWITEDDLPERFYDKQGWSGVMALPRELYQLEIKGVVSALRTKMEDIGSVTAWKGKDGLYDVETLGMRPGFEVERLRVGAKRRCEALKMDFSTDDLPASTNRLIKPLPISSRSWELLTTISLDPTAVDKVGFVLAHNTDMSQATLVYFDPAREVFVVDRRESTRLDEGIKIAPIEAPFTLFYLANQGEEGKKETQLERLNLRIFADNSVVEIFINDRACIATRIYPDETASMGLSFFVEGTTKEEGEGKKNMVCVERLDLWEGLASAFTPPASL